MSQSTWFHPGLALVLLAACSGTNDSDLFDGDPAASTDGTDTGASQATSSTDGSTNSTSTAPVTTASATSDGSSATSAGGSATTGTTGTGGEGGDAGDTSSGGGAGGSGGSGGSSSAGGNATGGSGGGGTVTTGSNECTPEDEVCDGLDNDCDDVVDEGEACPNDCIGASFDGHAYIFCVRPEGQQGNTPERSWAWAARFCSTRDQVLPRIDSAEENAFIYEQLNAMDGSGDVWMGATDQEDEGLWVWAQEDNDEGVPFYDAEEEEPIEDAFNDWADGEPDNRPGSADCGVFEELDDGQWAWADRDCDDEYPRLVCEDR